MNVPNIPKRKLQTWMKMESEHSSSPVVQKRIVVQHINKHGPRYYPALREMESKLPRR